MMNDTPRLVELSSSFLFPFSATFYWLTQGNWGVRR